MNTEKLETFAGEVLRDIGACYGMGLVRIGGELGLYKALHQHGPCTVKNLADHCDLNERYVSEWLANQAASGYVDYDRDFDCFSMGPEQAAVFVDDTNPFYMLPAFDTATAALGNQSMVQAAFTDGTGVGWGKQTSCLFCAVAAFFRPGYEENLVSNWLPSLNGVVEKLLEGALVADVGCGHGISTRIMAQAFPNSEFIGFDFHGPSIVCARQSAKDHGRLKNLRYEVSDARGFPGHDYDLITLFDCLHDLGDPVGAAQHAQRALKSDGSMMVVEPFAHDDLEHNLNAVGRIYYAASTMICIPASLDQDVGRALGAQAGEKRLREVIVTEGGFQSLTRTMETPFNLVLEARPQ